MKKICTLLTVLFGAISTGFAQDTTTVSFQYPFGEPGSVSRGVFGTDSRKEVKDAEGYADFVRATAVMVPREAIQGNRIYSYSLRQKLSKIYNTQRFDRGVRFLDQPSLAGCTGFLIAPDMLVTAGHCILDMEQAKKYVWLFDYTNELSFDPAKQYIEVKSENLYSVTDVYAAEFTEEYNEQIDYSVLILNRKADRKPYRFRTSGAVTVSTGINTIGSPTGLPLKLSGDSKVLDASPDHWFKTDIDAFPGNSGGPVFDKAGFIEGILVRGAVEYANDVYTGDYKYDEGCDCVKTVQFESANDNAGCQIHKITTLPGNILLEALYRNLDYAIRNRMNDRFDTWHAYGWIYTQNYVKNKGALEHTAIEQNNLYALERILKQASDSYTDAQQRQLLNRARSASLLETILKHGIYADAGQRSAGSTALQDAVKANRIALARVLIDYDADTKVTDRDKNNLLHLAAQTGNAELVKMFLNRDLASAKNSNKLLPEKVAQKSGYKEIAELIKRGRK